MPDAVVPSAPRERDRMPQGLPFSHFRLAAFFFAIAAVCGGGGVLALRALSSAPVPRQTVGVLAAAVAAACAIGFVGVLLHRRRVLPERWRETESYLAAIQRESQKYRLLMECAADMLLLVDPVGDRVRECNASAREALDAPAPDPPALAEHFSGDALDRVRAGIAAVSERPGTTRALGEVRLRSRTGRELVVDARVAGIPLAKDCVALLSLRDVTLQRAVERDLQLRDRLSSIGLLTAGVAHEINNPLEGIANYLRLAEHAEAAPDERRAHLAQVRRGFDRVRDIVRDLLRFASPDRGGGTADLAEVVAGAVGLARYSELFQRVHVETVGLDEPRPVVGDAGRLEQVVLNLLLNAATAMEGDGTIRLVAEEPAERDGPPGVALHVEDTGPGIAPEDLDRVFDPFFSGTGGTGLGLSVSYGIVRAHDGTLTVANRPGGGARFSVRLARRDGP